MQIVPRSLGWGLYLASPLFRHDQWITSIGIMQCRRLAKCLGTLSWIIYSSGNPTSSCWISIQFIFYFILMFRHAGSSSLDSGKFSLGEPHTAAISLWQSLTQWYVAIFCSHFSEFGPRSGLLSPKFLGSVTDIKLTRRRSRGYLIHTFVILRNSGYLTMFSRASLWSEAHTVWVLCDSLL